MDNILEANSKDGGAMLRDDFFMFISGIENGNKDQEKLSKLAESLDPVLIHFALRYIRESILRVIHGDRV